MRACKLHLSIVLPLILSVGLVPVTQTENIRVLYFPPWNISKLPLYFARDTGIFEKNGLNISWKDPGSNDKLLTAMKNGDGDIYVVSSNQVVRNNITGGPVLIIVGNTGYNYSVFLVEAPLDSPKTSKGRRSEPPKRAAHPIC